jgi:hemolysin type calcium-binding protein
VSWRLRIAAACVAGLSLAGSADAATVTGTPRADALRGTPNADRIVGRQGDDRLHGAAGDDLLLGGPGADLLVGGRGADVLRCGPGRDAAVRDVRDSVAKDCEVVRGPKPPPAPPPAPPPPPPPPPPPAPGASATYVFGPEVTPSQQNALRAGLDLGARFIRSAVQHELPAFTVWAFTDLESLVRVYAETAPTEPANSRDIWTRGTFATVTLRKAWFGPNWLNEGSSSNALKIAVHETFHVLQFELAGDRSMNSGFDDLPRAGPRWIFEGSAELVGYLAIADARLTTIASVRSDWAQRARTSPVSLERLAFLRGQFDAGPNAWGIMPLAVERLVGEGGLPKVLSYLAAIGRGEPWEAAFAAVFGKTVDAFYAEFAAYRGTL